MRHLPEYCAACGEEIRTLETCVLPGGVRKRAGEVTFRESVDPGVLCVPCVEGRGAFFIYDEVSEVSPEVWAKLLEESGLVED